jgi:hypothetical protein
MLMTSKNERLTTQFKQDYIILLSHLRYRQSLTTAVCWLKPKWIRIGPADSVEYRNTTFRRNGLGRSNPGWPGDESVATLFRTLFELSKFDDILICRWRFSLKLFHSLQDEKTSWPFDSCCQFETFGWLPIGEKISQNVDTWSQLHKNSVI